METADLGYWEFTDSKWQRENLHKPKLSPLNVGDSCVAGEVYGQSMAVKSGFITSAWSDFLEPILFGRIPCWLPMGRLILSEEWMGSTVGESRKEQEEERDRELEFVYKMRKDCFKKQI